MRTLCFIVLIFLSFLTTGFAGRPAQLPASPTELSAVYAVGAAAAECALLQVTNANDAPTVSPDEETNHTAVAQSILSARDTAVARWKALLNTAVSARFAWVWLFFVLLGVKRL
jgi:ferritin-like protein